MAWMENRMNEEKEFHHFLDFPLKIRKVVIDEMEGIDRCRFTRCSKQSNTDAESSENLVHQLVFTLVSINYIEIEVKHSLHPIGNEEPWGYKLIFKEREGKRIKQYESFYFRTSWEIELEGSENIFEQSIEEFKKLLQTHQNALRRLEVNDFSRARNNLESINFGVKSLKNLRIVDVFGNVNLLQFLSILEKPLVQLHIRRNDEEFHEQICLVSHQVVLENPNITNEQFRRITAKNVYTLIGQLSERNVLQFIRAWQDGTIGREINICQWTLRDSIFDLRKLLRWLRLPYGNLESGNGEIKHYIETGMSARFLWFERSLEFQPIKRIENE